MSKRKKFDSNSPDAHKIAHEIVHGAFTTEGTMVAFPLCFPGATSPIVADESRITALDATPDGIIYGGTSGHLAHLFVGVLNGATGMVFDIGAAPNATHCAGVCCGKEKLIAAVNGPGGGRIIRCDLHGLPSDLLQEWGFTRPEFQDLGEVVAGERIAHAIADASDERVIIATDRHLLVLGFGEGTPRVIGEITGKARLGLGSKGSVFGLDDDDTLWRYKPDADALERKAVALPQGDWKSAPLMWGRDPVDGTLYTADAEGRLFSMREGNGSASEPVFSDCLGKTLLAPVGPMAATFDGRLFGTCGNEMSKHFCYDPATGELASTGVAVSVIERRRYGYVFGDAVTGRDGQIFFGEDDDLGHLWIYFPKILKRRP
jgi:hypothetical protein